MLTYHRYPPTRFIFFGGGLQVSFPTKNFFLPLSENIVSKKILGLKKNLAKKTRLTSEQSLMSSSSTSFRAILEILNLRVS